MIEWIKSIFALFFPRCCVVCGNPLLDAEEMLCVACNIDMPRTGYHLLSGNPAERLFWGKIRIEHATSFFFYSKGSNYRNILYDLKYRGNKKLGETMGRFIATELLCSHFFEGIDVIIPVPLHPDKKMKRGYNQSEWIAKGVAAVSGISVDLIAVTRVKDTETQTKKTNFERWENVNGIFKLVSPPSSFEGKHILIIDDVLTTGATIIACASVFNGIPDLRVSVLTLAMAT